MRNSESSPTQAANGEQLPSSWAMGLAQGSALGFGLGSQVSVRPFKVRWARACVGRYPFLLGEYGPGVALGPWQRFLSPPAISSMTSAAEHAEVRLILTREAPRQASAATSRWTSSSCLPPIQSLPLSRLNLPIYLMGVGRSDCCGYPATRPRRSGCVHCSRSERLASARPSQRRAGESAARSP